MSTQFSMTVLVKGGISQGGRKVPWHQLVSIHVQGFLCLCLTFLSSVFRLFFCCFYSLYSLLFWPYFSSYCLSDPTFPFLLLLYSLYSLLFWPYFSFSSAAARKVKQRHKTAFLSRFHQKVEEIHFKLEKTVKNRYSWLIWSTRFARTSKRHS